MKRPRLSVPLMQLTQEGALAARSKKKPTSYFCHKVGHINKDCEEYAKVKGQSDKKVNVQRKPQWERSKLPSQLMMKTALRAADWWKHRRCQLALPPRSSGLWSACHMCNKESMFTAVQTLPTPMSAPLRERGIRAAKCACAHVTERVRAAGYVCACAKII